MKNIIKLSLVAAVASTFAFASTSDDIAALQAQIDELKAANEDVMTKVSSNNLKWDVDFRTSYDNISYDVADGTSKGNDYLTSMRLQLGMGYALDEQNLFKAKLSMHKTFGADVTGSRIDGLVNFDWIINEALTDNNIRVKEASWVYMDNMDFAGVEVPWSFSLGRRPSTDGFLANYREDLTDPGSSNAHIINIEFDGFSNNYDLSNLSGVEGMYLKLCGGIATTNAIGRYNSPFDYAEDENGLDNTTMVGVIFVPYNDGQLNVRANWFYSWNTIDLINPQETDPTKVGDMKVVGDMQAGALSASYDGLGESDFLSESRIFASVAYTYSHPIDGEAMVGSFDSEAAYSLWVGANVPVGEDGVFGVEYNYGSQYWRPFTFSEDTMIGSKISTRGNAYETYFNYQITDAISAQVRYTYLDYEYTGSNGFFGDTTGNSVKIDDIKDAAAAGDEQSIAMLPSIVESAQDFRFFLRYKF